VGQGREAMPSWTSVPKRSSALSGERNGSRMRPETDGYLGTVRLSICVKT
jgi:hypothetical protein